MLFVKTHLDRSLVLANLVSLEMESIAQPSPATRQNVLQLEEVVREEHVDVQHTRWSSKTNVPICHT